jgi:glycerol-3-phosphate dehydrogenase
MIYDVIVIGAGISGSLIARKLAKYQLKVGVLDKENEIGNETTSANSAIIHSGYDPKPGTLKAKLNVLGNKMYDQIAEELDVRFIRNGSLTVATSLEQLETLKELAERSEINGVPYKLLSKEETLENEPNLTNEVVGSLFAPTCGIIDPFNLVVHAMENAVDNGVHLFLNEEVIAINKENDYFIVKTRKNEYKTDILINAAGNFADKIAAMFEKINWNIKPRKGQYFLLAKNPDFVNKTIFPLPSEKGKGVLVIKTTSDNIMVGPSSEFVEEKDDVQTDAITLQNVKEQASILFKNIPFGETIRIFSGLRPTPSTHDFIIDYSKKDKHFINVAGIESPGLASAPAIAEYVVNELISPLIILKEKDNYNPYVKKYHVLKYMSLEERNNLIKQNSDFGKIICSCEQISLGEIKETLSSSVPPRSIKSIKKRTRAGFGQCQSGFCTTLMMQILADHYKIDLNEVNYDNENSNISLNKIKEVK